jgi:F420-dependent oxidoreductase-like protein
MKLGLILGYGGKRINFPMDLILQAESLGYDSVWTAEAWGADAVSTASWVLAQTTTLKVGTAIMQMPARTPAMTAMTALTLSQLSNNRFILGLGVSGPQVVEGWHGAPYGKPMTRTREYIQIVKEIFAREKPLEFDGEMYQIPNRADGTTGLGKPLKTILEGNSNIPVYTASITPAGLACAGEFADGVFPVWMSPDQCELVGEHVSKGINRAEGKTASDFEVAPFVSVVLGDDVKACMDALRPSLALYIGGMGARDKNFYNDYAVRMGYGAEAKQIQDLYLAGNKAEAIARVPDELVDEVYLVGPKARIAKRAQRWKAAGDSGQIGAMLLGVSQPEVLEIMAELML